VLKNPILTLFIVASTGCQANHVQNDSFPWPLVVILGVFKSFYAEFV
jgi:hypothetical protein